MPNLQVIDCSNLKPTLTSLFAPRLLHRTQTQPHPRFISKASLQHPHHSSSSPPPALLIRRQLISQTASLSLSIATLLAFQLPAKSEEVLSEWERVYLPIDPGVVLLDVAFVPDDLNHGFSSFFHLMNLRFQLLWLSGAEYLISIYLF